MAKKKVETKEAAGCRLCKYRVAPPVGPNGQKVPRCCFGHEVNDKEIPDCGMFTESNFYKNHPEEP